MRRSSSSRVSSAMLDVPAMSDSADLRLCMAAMCSSTVVPVVRVVTVTVRV